jgi:biotin transporter BioY
MYIIAIAWLYVVVLMAATEKTIIAGILTFIFYGLVPCALLLWILGRNHRHFKQHKASQTREDDTVTPEQEADDRPLN